MCIIVYRSKDNPYINSIAIYPDGDLIQALHDIGPVVKEYVDIFINASRL